jgi:hydroxymethylpyrimidine pyrophosphatase-like HAD family hydrolase
MADDVRLLIADMDGTLVTQDKVLTARPFYCHQRPAAARNEDVD